MKRKDIKALVRDYFMLNPTARLRVREIERRTGAPLPSVIRYARELEKEGILRSSEVSGVRLYSADRASDTFLAAKRVRNLELLYESGLVEHLRRELGNPCIVLFGSYSRGEDVEDSDIDLYIETKESPDLSRFAKGLGRGIQLFRHRSIRGVRNRELANNIINGITLNGYLEVLRE